MSAHRGRLFRGSASPGIGKAPRRLRAKGRDVARHFLDGRMPVKHAPYGRLAGQLRGGEVEKRFTAVLAAPGAAAGDCAQACAVLPPQAITVSQTSRPFSSCARLSTSMPSSPKPRSGKNAVAMLCGRRAGRARTDAVSYPYILQVWVVPFLIFQRGEVAVAGAEAVIALRRATLRRLSSMANGLLSWKSVLPTTCSSTVSPVKAHVFA